MWLSNGLVMVAIFERRNRIDSLEKGALRVLGLWQHTHHGNFTIYSATKVWSKWDIAFV
jgi:hypothetical protein